MYLSIDLMALLEGIRSRTGLTALYLGVEWGGAVATGAKMHEIYSKCVQKKQKWLSLAIR